MTARILLVDDHRVVRDSLRAILERAKFEIVAEASDGWQAVALATKHRPDAIVMDVSMPLLNGTDAAREILAVSPQLPIVLLTVHSEEHHIMFALRAGVRGYIIKTQASSELVRAIRDVLAGQTYLSPALSGALVHGYLTKAANTPATLTARERQVLQLVAEGKSTKEAAVILKLTTKTVEYYRSCVMGKVGVHNVAGLVHYAVKHGLVELVMTPPPDEHDSEPPAKKRQASTGAVAAEHQAARSRAKPGAASARILVIHSHRVVREGLRMLFEESAVNVVGETADRDAALKLARELQPDVIVIDMPDGTDAIDCGRDILAAVPSTAIVVVAGSIDEDHVVAALRGGIRGYVIKSQPAAEILQAVKDVHAGGTYLSPAISRIVAKLYREGGSSNDALTPRQRDVLRLIASGYSTKQIADVLSLSEKTVDLYRSRIMVRLGIHDIATLVRYAILIGLVSA